MTAAQILAELVTIPTPSSVSNLPLLHWVADFLEPRGWQVQLFPYADEAGIPKANLIAWPSPNPGSAPHPTFFELAFVCHTDTVPYAAAWTSALSLIERDGNLHACGSCDVKGSLACFLAAIASTKVSNISPNIALILTADEEIGCKGMERLLASTQLRIGSAIVSEPTSLQPGISGKGYGLVRITIHGREAHSAFPQQGVSAISAAARLILQIEKSYLANTPPDPLFHPPATTCNIGLIEGGSAKNIIPGRTSFLVEWRAIPAEAPTTVLERLRQLVATAQAEEPKVHFELEGLRADPGFSPAPSGPLQAKFAKLLNRKPMGISFGSEASRLAAIAQEVIVIGPGDMQTAHSDRECVPAAELERWTEVLSTLIALECQEISD